jgi:hypothetical protein
MDGGLNNVYDAIYGGPAISLNETPTPTAMGGWSPESWDLTNFNIGDFGTNVPAPSALSVSEESLSSGGEELPVPSDLSLSTTGIDYRNAILTTCSNNETFILDPLEPNNYAM